MEAAVAPAGLSCRRSIGVGFPWQLKDPLRRTGKQANKNDTDQSLFFQRSSPDHSLLCYHNVASHVATMQPCSSVGNLFQPI